MLHKLEWYVYRYNINSRKIERYNVFEHSGFVNQLGKLPNERNLFAERLRREAQYYFWSKCEMETVVCSWPVYIDYDEYRRLRDEVDIKSQQSSAIRVLNVSPTVGEKIDIYDQLTLNWEAFVNYTWNALHT